MVRPRVRAMYLICSCVLENQAFSYSSCLFRVFRSSYEITLLNTVALVHAYIYMPSRNLCVGGARLLEAN